MFNIKLCLTIFAIVLGTSFQFGYQTGVLNAPLKIIEEFINSTSHTNGTLDTNKLHLISSFVVASFPAGGLFGAMSGGYLADRFGRKLALIMTSVPTALGSICMFLAYIMKLYPLIIIGRVIIGITCGIYTCIAPMYLSEISPLQNKGVAGVINQFFIVIGLLISQILGLKFILGTFDRWQYLLSFSLIPCILQIIMLIFCPESPRYLLITRKDEQASRNALIFLRSTDDVEHEIEEMNQEKESCCTESSVPFKFFFIRRHLRWGLMISIVMQLSQQLSGINCVIYYSNKIFVHAGFSLDHASYATIGVGFTNLLTTFVSVFLIERLGRKTLHLTGLCGMLFFGVTLSLLLIFKLKFKLSIYFIMASIFMFVASFGVGPGSIPWFIVAEMFTQEARGTAIAVAVFVNWICQIAIGIGYPLLLTYLQDFSFLPFVGLLSIFVLFTIKCVPETRGKTPEEIENYFKRLVGSRHYDEAPLLTNSSIGPIMVDEFDYRI